MGEQYDDPTAASALAAMFVRHRPRLRQTLKRLGVAEANLDDAVQDVFVVLVRRIDEYDADREEGGVEAWLRGIARRIASNHRRGDSRARRLRAELAIAPPFEPGQAERTHAAEILHAFLGSLTSEQCEVFVLGEVHGLTGPEIAAQLGIKLDTAYSRLRAARRQLQRTAVRIRSRERPPYRTAAFALLPRFLVGVAAMKLAVGLPLVLLLVSTIGMGVQLGVGGRARTSDPALARDADCAFIGSIPTMRWSDACGVRREQCQERVDSCRRELSSCEQHYAERLPLPMRFEEQTENEANEDRLAPLLERVADASGSEVSVECRGDVCRIVATTTDEVLASRPADDAPGMVLQRDPAYATEVVGGSFASSIPSTDLHTGEGVWIDELWVRLRQVPEGGVP
jgi:RNA polymerase sigma-70 factor, ECF subfamily